MKYCSCGYQTKENIRICPKCGQILNYRSYDETFDEDDEGTVYASQPSTPLTKVSLTKTGSDRVSLVKPGSSHNTIQFEVRQAQPQQPAQDYGDGFKTVPAAPPAAPPAADYAPAPQKKPWKKALLTVGEIAAAVVLLFGAFVLYRSIDFTKHDPDSDSDSETLSQTSSAAETQTGIPVPDVVGFSRDTAADIIKNAGFECLVETAPSSDVREDTVLSQTPEGQVRAVKGSPVKIVVALSDTVSTAGTSSAASSSGTSSVNKNTSSKTKTEKLVTSMLETVSVPNVCGMKLEDAEKKLKSSSLVPAVASREYSDSVKEGCVISQEPSGGKSTKNSTVSLVVSKGEDPDQYVTVGKYIGMDINDVIAELKSQDLEPQWDYVDDPRMVRNSIVSQEPKENSKLKRGSVVSLTVANGLDNQQHVPSVAPTSGDTSAAPPAETAKPVFSDVRASSVRASEGSYTYDAKNAIYDNDACWCEGASDGGVGEYVLFTAGSEQTVSGVRIKNGYTRDQTVFNNNGRAKKVRFELSDGSSIEADLDPNERSMQDIAFSEPVKTTYIKMILTEVQDGDKYKDTCITLIVPY